MTVELIPVLEITGYDSNIPMPAGPYWEHEDAWESYRQAGLQSAGYDSMIPYRTASPFYRLTDISAENLVQLTLEHTQGIRNGEYEREGACPFYGGYVLRVDGEDIFFPQCCGDLSDIQYWEKLAQGNKNAYYEGHPNPQIEIKNSFIYFDFSTDEFDEPFQPTPPQTQIHIPLSQLQETIRIAKEELFPFVVQLQKINVEENLNIPRIEFLLVYGDDENR